MSKKAAERFLIAAIKYNILLLRDIVSSYQINALLFK
jgi:hypothetical protein